MSRQDVNYISYKTSWICKNEKYEIIQERAIQAHGRTKSDTSPWQNKERYKPMAKQRAMQAKQTKQKTRKTDYVQKSSCTISGVARNEQALHAKCFGAP